VSRSAAERRSTRGEDGPPGASARARAEAEEEVRRDAAVEQALGRARGAVFTPLAEARLLAALGLAQAAARRGGPPPADSLQMLFGLAPAAPALTAALEGLVVLDPACGAGALLAAAARLAEGAGARLRLHGIEIAPEAAEACRRRLEALGADLLGRGSQPDPTPVLRADALAVPWPAADLVLMNPPFLRHEALPAAEKTRAAARSGLSRQADLSAHFALLALRHAGTVALVWPRALSVSRSAAPLLAEARARGGFALTLRSRAAGSFAASVDTALSVWSLGGSSGPAAEAAVALDALREAELCAAWRGLSTPRLALRRPARPAPRGAGTVGDVAQVRFGMKSGCNAFFHLEPLGGGLYRSALGGEVTLDPAEAPPLLASLKEALAPARARAARVLFRPGPSPGPLALAYVARGEALGVAARATCRARSPWWAVAPGRAVAPVLYPAKVGARAFAFLNEEGLCEDKKWLALFPRALEARLLAALLSATPIRLWVDEAARQLTGAQAIADVDQGVLSRAPFPRPDAVAPLAREVARCFEALARDPVTTDLAAMLDRPAQRALDELAGRALGLSPRALASTRRALLARVEARLGHAAQVRAAVASAGR
jgi:predicted RNA methylase